MNPLSARVLRLRPGRLGGVAALLALAAGGVVADHVLSAAPDVADGATIALAIAGEPLRIPAEAIRFSDQRRGGDLPRVDLALLWPDLAGRSARTATDFAHAGAESRVVQIAVEPRETDLDSAARLATIYTRYLTAEAFAGPAGLVGWRFRDDSAYAGETLYFEPGAVRPFVARCFPRTGKGADDLCLTEFTFGGRLVAAYRFRPALLAEWPDLDAKVRAAVAGYVQ